MTQHVTPYNWHTLVSLLLYSGSFVRMVLSTDKTFLFGRTVFSRMAETLVVEAALHDRNWRSKFLQNYYARYLAN